MTTYVPRLDLESQDPALEQMAEHFKAQDLGGTMPDLAAYYRVRNMAAVAFQIDNGPAADDRVVSNEEIAELAVAEADAVIPFASVHPARGAVGASTAERLITEYGVRGFKFQSRTRSRSTWPSRTRR